MAPNPLDQFRYAIPDSRMAELPEIGEILADLGVGQPPRLTKLPARHRPAVVLTESLKLPQVNAKLANRRTAGIGMFSDLAMEPRPAVPLAGVRTMHNRCSKIKSRLPERRKVRGRPTALHTAINDS